jgi:chromosome partitioning protein
VAGLGWPTDNGGPGQGLGWPSNEKHAGLPNGPGVVSRETDQPVAPMAADDDAASSTLNRSSGAAPTGRPLPLADVSQAPATSLGLESPASPTDPVSRETPAREREESSPVTEVEGLPDSATQGVDHARFGPTLAPGPIPVTAAEIAAATDGRFSDTSTPLASAAEEEVRAGMLRSRGLPRPDETRVLVIANQKGGVGKTTTTVNMAAGLAQHGLRALIIDLDPQGNASTALGIDHSAGTPGVYEVIADGVAMGEVVRECPDVPNLFGVPATIDLAGAEIELVSLVARESRLRKALDAYLNDLDADQRFDYVFIDCPPSLGLLTINALVAGREMLIPIQCEYYALEGVTQLLRNVEMVRAHLNPELQVSTIVLTMYDGRTRLSSGVADEVRQHFGEVVLRTAIPRSVRISEAPSYGQTVITYDPTSSGALSYLEAARELATHHPKQPQQTEAQ